MKKILATLLFLAWTLSMAQEYGTVVIVDPPSGEYLINPTSNLELDLWVDRSSSQGMPGYQIGDSIRISFRVNAPACVSIFGISADGQIVMLYPNRYDEQNCLPRAGTRTLPSNNGYGLQIAGPLGVDRIFAIATNLPLDLSGIAKYQSGNAFAAYLGPERQFGSRLYGRLEVVPQQNPSPAAPQLDWVTAMIRYRVLPR